MIDYKEFDSEVFFLPSMTALLCVQEIDLKNLVTSEFFGFVLVLSSSFFVTCSERRISSFFI